MSARGAVLVTATEPEPRSFGKRVVLGGILDHLCHRLGAGSVHVVLVGDPHVDRPPVPYRLHVVPRPGAVQQALTVLRRVVPPPHVSLQEAALGASEVTRQVQELVRSIDAPLEIWDTVRLAQHAPARPAAGVRRLLYLDDLFSERYAGMLEALTEGNESVNPGGEFAKLLPGPARGLLARPAVYRPLLQLERRLVARSELRHPPRFDLSLLVSEHEVTSLRARLGERAAVAVLPPLLREPAVVPRSPAARPTFAVLGGLDFAPNADGLAWFLAECREAVQAVLPDVRIVVLGPGTERGLPEAGPWGGAVQFKGWVDDLSAELAGCTALLSPLRIGSGVKIKVLESLARGLPVVGTPVGVQGLADPGGSGCLVGRGPRELAALMAEAARPELNARLSRDARATWERTYATPVLRRLYDDVFGFDGTAAAPASTGDPAAGADPGGTAGRAPGDADAGAPGASAGGAA